MSRTSRSTWASTFTSSHFMAASARDEVVFQVGYLVAERDKKRCQELFRCDRAILARCL